MPFFSPDPSVNLFYTTTGSASNPPVLLIHGWGGNSHDWSWQIPFLAPNYHVIAFDSRGHGQSKADESASFTNATLISDCVALLQHLGITSNVTFLGHSLGGVTASGLSVKHPDLVRALVLVDPGYNVPTADCDATWATISGPDAITEWGIAFFQAMLYHESTPSWMKTCKYSRSTTYSYAS